MVSDIYTVLLNAMILRKYGIKYNSILQIQYYKVNRVIFLTRISLGNLMYVSLISI